ncbi:MAG: hypothetical protein RJA36_3445 [Pseudomonadota bacterium]
MKKVSLFALLSAAAITLSAQAQPPVKSAAPERKVSQRKPLHPLAGSPDARAEIARR